MLIYTSHCQCKFLVIASLQRPQSWIQNKKTTIQKICLSPYHIFDFRDFCIVSFLYSLIVYFDLNDLLFCFYVAWHHLHIWFLTIYCFVTMHLTWSYMVCLEINVGFFFVSLQPDAVLHVEFSNFVLFCFVFVYSMTPSFILILMIYVFVLFPFTLTPSYMLILMTKYCFACTDWPNLLVDFNVLCGVLFLYILTPSDMLILVIMYCFVSEQADSTLHVDFNDLCGSVQVHVWWTFLARARIWKKWLQWHLVDKSFVYQQSS